MARVSNVVRMRYIAIMRLTLIILLPFVGALLAAFLPAKAGNAAAWQQRLIPSGAGRGSYAAVDVQ